ncbi:protein of unknown function [Pseudomonas mediterranea]
MIQQHIRPVGPGRPSTLNPEQRTDDAAQRSRGKGGVRLFHSHFQKSLSFIWDGCRTQFEIVAELNSLRQHLIYPA